MSLKSLRLFLLLCVLPAGISGVCASDLETIVERLDTAAPAFDQAVDAAGFSLPLDYGSLDLEHGVLVPVTVSADERLFELLYHGHGRLRLEIPDGVETQQLHQFSGDTKLDVPLRSAILILGDGENRLADRSVVEVEPETRSHLRRLFDEWSRDAERQGFGAREGLIRAMAGDPVGRGYLGIWLESDTLGRAFYRRDPSGKEPVSFGAYELFDSADFRSYRERKRKQRFDSFKRKQERKQRPSTTEPSAGSAEEGQETRCGRRQDEEEGSREHDEIFPWIKTWVSTTRPGADPKSDPPGFEPEHYAIDVTLSGEELFAEGRARIRLRPNADDLRVVSLSLGEQLEVCEVLGADDQPLPFDQHGWKVVVSLPQPSDTNEAVDLNVAFAGRPIERLSNRRTQRYTIRWHPHAGHLDRATYDVTLRWPAGLSLLASGEEAGGGEADGQRWTRRVIEAPTIGFSFEIGDLAVIRDRVGHLELALGFDRGDDKMTPAIQHDVVKTVKDSLRFFEEQLGPLPIDRLELATVSRDASQGLLGFVTLADAALHARPLAFFDNRTGQEIRTETIAHEISHQWWGNVVGWDGYRDQWLSEALASFSAAAFMATRAPRPETYLRRHAEMWRSALRAETFDGRPLGALGPVVLGTRLLENHGAEVYQTIVYDKGSVVFSTLAQRLGSEATWRMLGALSKAVGNRAIRTSTFFRSMEHMSGQNLQEFVKQYVHGTGLPMVFYDARFARNEQGGWIVEGEVRQLPAEKFRYVLERVDHGWDVLRRISEDQEVSDWANVIPFYIETAGDSGERGAFLGKITVRGERSTFSIPVDGRPVLFELDPFGENLAEFQSRRFAPKGYLLRLGEHLARLGWADEAHATLIEALEEDLAVGETAGEESAEGAQRARELDVRARLALARLGLDRGDVASAKTELREADRLLSKKDDFYAGERMVLHARLSLRGGRPESVMAQIREYLDVHAVDLGTVRADRLLDKSKHTALKFSRGEVLALNAAAAHEIRDQDADLLARQAKLAGVDVGALE